ncbi:hypothetical protein R1sor_019442 [Riccia sorocarpa]|uniref:Uncharacterized protein n=1 Tax=Riccia sorocarpa TaxID=122646 RepID=A0ABD3IGB3_9MARC
MIGDDVYDEFEKSRMKTPPNRPWYNENMTSMAAAYILSFAEETAAKEAHRATEEAEEKRLGKALTAKAKKDFVGVDRVKAFAFAGIHNSLKIELLRAHYSDVTVKNRYHHPVNNDVDKDVRPWLAQWSLWSALELLSSDLIKKIGKRNLPDDMTPEEVTSKLEEDVDRFMVFFCDTRDKFWAYLWFPIDEREDVSVNIQRAKRIVFRYFVWHEQGRAPASFSLWNKEESEYCMYSDKDNLCRSLASLTKWEIQDCPWWLEQRCDDSEVKFVGDAEEMCWKKLQDGEEPFAATKNKFETLEEGAMLDEAKILEPNKDVDGLVVDTTRTKKLKEAAYDEEEWDTTTPKKKTSETKNPGSGKWMHSYLHFILPADLAGTLSNFVKAVYKPHSCYPGRGSKARGKQSAGVEKPPKKSRKNGVEEVEKEAITEAGGSQPAPTQEVEPAAPVADLSEVLEVEPAEEADEERQRKRPKKRETEVSKLYEGSFRSDIYVSFPQPVVVVKSSLKLTVDALQANKSSAVKEKVVLVEALKALCSRINPFRPQGCFINTKETNVAADCLFLDMPSGLKTFSSWGEVPNWNEYPEDDDLPRKLMNLGPVILDDRGCLIILHQGTLRSNQQIADALDANTSNWKHLASYDVNSDVPQFEPVRNMKVFHSKADIFCKSGHTFNIPKLDMAPFDPDNSGRDVAMISNYNTFVPKKLDDGGRRKCVGFLQT